jgi:hypothetical protein
MVLWLIPVGIWLIPVGLKPMVIGCRGYPNSRRRLTGISNLRRPRIDRRELVLIPVGQANRRR